MNRDVVMAVLLFLFIQCGEGKKDASLERDSAGDSEALFTLLSPAETKLNFINIISESPAVNGLVYEYLYNGGGVAAGDLNGDGLPDLFFISTLYSNKLFVNQGDFRFEEATLKSGVRGSRGFPTGVALVDINADGLLDIYVCKSGDYAELEPRKNELYVNQGNNEAGIPRFEEEALKYGLDLPHYSTQAAFFDFDRDGDLDMFLLNHGIEPADVESNLATLIHQKSEYSSEKLFRNDNGYFHDVSYSSGITNNAIGFGLGIAIGDLNNDQWPDILVGQDYSEKDHLYINQKDGTFSEVIRKATNHISNASMGNDIGDIDNDGRLDFFSLDMAPDNNYDLKTSLSGMDQQRFDHLVDLDLHHQYMFNMLQWNTGIVLEGNTPVFAEIGQLAGVSNTNWSWSPLFMDMDNDGWQDLFVSNGIVRSFRNNDFVEYKRERVYRLYKDMELHQNKDSLIKLYYEEILAVMPEKKEVNLFFLNNQDFRFASMHEDWDLQVPSNSNGAVYADLDNDGDLDIVTNNINDAAFVYRNNTRELKTNSNYLQVKLSGSAGNTLGIGARITIETGETKQMKELYLSRGFQSSVSSILHFGVGRSTSVDKLLVVWPDGKFQSIQDLKANQQVTVDYKESAGAYVPISAYDRNHTFKDVTDKSGIAYRHTENQYNDFARERLLPHRLSQNGPSLSVGDVNIDGLDDFYIGGARNQAAQLFIQQQDGTFKPSSDVLWEEDNQYEDVASKFFDADNDGDLDLYVVSGGNEKGEGDEYYRDRLYINSGDGTFLKIPTALPDIRMSGSCVVAGDMDNDGDLDLFIGGKMIPGKYPLPANSYLLRNESRKDALKFMDVTADMAPFMNGLGMVSDAIWVDLDNDANLDLAVVGEWMPVKIIKNTGDRFIDATGESGLGDQAGWWFSIASADFDEDGDLDIIAGNLGLNYTYKASPDEPFEVYANDFDNNGILDIVLAYHEEGTLYPVRGRACASDQMPFIKNKFPAYEDYGVADLTTIYGADLLLQSVHHQASTFATAYIENLGGLKFQSRALGGTAQFSSVNSILVEDFNRDGNLDALLSGNLYQSEIETPRNDASFGVLLEGDGNGGFICSDPAESRLYIRGDVKNAAIIHTDKAGKKRVIFAKNDDYIQFVEF